MRRVKLDVSYSLLCDFFKVTAYGCRKTNAPDDLKVTAVLPPDSANIAHRTFTVELESGTFGEVSEGGEIPYIGMFKPKG